MKNPTRNTAVAEGDLYESDTNSPTFFLGGGGGGIGNEKTITHQKG
jgi:hypothetical protein